MSHALFSPSSSHRWMVCPGSIKLSEGETDTGGQAAQEGTFLHECMQKHLQDGVPLTSFSLNEEQLSILTECARHVTDLLNSNIIGLLGEYEMKVEFGDYIGQPNSEAFGTADVVLVFEREGKTICRIIDYKFGRNYVDPMYNTQGGLYMLGVKSNLDLLGFDVDEFEFEILQPRSSGKLSNGVFKMSANRLMEWAYDATSVCGKVKEAMRTYDIDENIRWVQTYLQPSESTCEFCRAAYKCPALKNMMSLCESTGRKSDSELADMFDNLDENTLSNQLAKVPMMKRYIEALEAEGMNRALNGNIPKGFKLIEGRAGNRKWVDKDTATAKFCDLGYSVFDYTETSIKSPAQMEKKLISDKFDREKARAIIEELVERTPPKPTLVPVHKEGKEWQPVAVEQQFDVLS